MKKLIKKTFVFAILTAFSISYITNLQAYRRGRGGWGWGGFATGAVLGGLIGSAASRGGGGGSYGYDNLDAMGASFWEVTNNSNNTPILVRASGNKNFMRIAPGQTVRIPRRRSFKLYAKTIGDKRRRPNSTVITDHFVDITIENENVFFEGYNEASQQSY